MYIHDYLAKRDHKASAQTFQGEGKISSGPLAIDAPGGFLSEWWSIFWNLFVTGDIGKDSEVAASYIKTQLIKAREQQQQTEHQNHQQELQMQLLMMRRQAQPAQQHQGDRSQDIKIQDVKIEQDIKIEVNPVMNPRSVGPQGSSIGISGSNQGGNNLTSKGWPDIKIEQEDIKPNRNIKIEADKKIEQDIKIEQEDIKPHHKIKIEADIKIEQDIKSEQDIKIEQDDEDGSDDEGLSDEEDGSDDEGLSDEEDGSDEEHESDEEDGSSDDEHGSPDDYVVDENRIDRALSQTLFLVDRSDAKFSVLGATRKVYTVTLSLTPSCNCPDPIKPCKHMYFVLIRVLCVSLNDACLRKRNLHPSQLHRLMRTETSSESLASDEIIGIYHREAAKSKKNSSVGTTDKYLDLSAYLSEDESHLEEQRRFHRKRYRRGWSWYDD